MEAPIKQCCECHDGEHENYDNDVRLVTVRNPDTNLLIRRGYHCKEHRKAAENDGYTVHPA